MQLRVICGLLVPLLAVGWSTHMGSGTPNGGGGGPTCTTDIPARNFSSGTIGTEWDAAGDVDQTNCPWLIATDELNWDSDDQNLCDSASFSALVKDDTVDDAVDQWSCWTLAGTSGGTAEYSGVFRAGSSTESTSWLNVYVISGSAVVHMSQGPAGASAGNCTASETVDLTDEICAHVTGTGNGITAAIWINPASGTTPQDFGTADCTITTTGMTDNTGSYVGVSIEAGNPNANSHAEFDDYRAGSCS